MQAMGVGAPAGPRKSLHRHSFWQQSLPFAKATPHANPVWQRLSSGSAESRVCPTQSLSCVQPALQNAAVFTAPVAPGWTAGLRQMKLGHSPAEEL